MILDGLNQRAGRSAELGRLPEHRPTPIHLVDSPPVEISVLSLLQL